MGLYCNHVEGTARNRRASGYQGQETEMGFEHIVAACQQAIDMQDQVSDDQMRNAMRNIRAAAGANGGIDPNSLRPSEYRDGDIVYTADVTKEQALQVIESIRAWAQSWIDRPVQ